MSEIKLQAGQWYRPRGGEIRYCIGMSPIKDDNYPALVSSDEDCEDTEWHKADGSYSSAKFGSSNDIIEHLPDCTGFDWVPAPKLQLREGAWYERKDGVVVGPCKKSGLDDLPWFFGNFFYRNDGTNNATDWCYLIREVDPPQPPQPKYRPFKNAEEFKPFRNCWWYRDDSDGRKHFPPMYYSDSFHGGISFAYRFKTCFFEDGTPFGVLDDGT
jgi:hypothetical protein